MSPSPTDPNLARLSEEAFERHGDYDSILFEGAWHRSGALFERTRRLAAGLVALGVAPGDRVAVVMSNSPDVPVVYTALWRAGAVVTPVIFLVGPDELGRILGDSGAVAVVASPEFLPSVVGAAGEAGTVRWVVAAGPAAAEDERLVTMADLEQADPGPIVPRAGADLAALMYTGGTTGRAKGVMLSHENLWFCGRSANEASFVSGVNRAIIPLPLSHGFGLITTIVGLHAPEPGQAVLMRWFDPDGWLRLVAEQRVQRGAMVPSMLQILLGSPLEEHDLSALRFVTVGAAPLAPDVAREFARRVPGVEVLEGYGCTESGAVISVNRPGAGRLGSVGTPIDGYEVRVVGEDGADVGPGEPGEIACRSRGVMLGYWGDEEATAAALRDGWLFTGDLGRLDADGYLWIVDRKKELIIRGGFNVFPRDVEDALLEHPDIVMAGVVGRPHERLGEEVVAFVQLRPGSSAGPEDVVAFAKERIGAHRYPREVRVVPVVPLTPVGKVDRKALRASLGTG